MILHTQPFSLASPIGHRLVGIAAAPSQQRQGCCSGALRAYLLQGLGLVTGRDGDHLSPAAAPQLPEQSWGRT